MAANLHTIQKQSFEVDFPSEDKVYDFQERFSRLVKDKIARIIETTFDKVSSAENILRISRLEIDLGTIDYNNLERDITFKLERQLLQALERKITSIKEHPVKGQDEIISTQRSLVEVFAFYLQTGMLPWWGRYVREHNISIEQVLELLLQHDPENTVKETLVHLPVKSARERFVKQFKDDLLLQFIKVIYPGKERIVQDSLKAITSVFTSIKAVAPQVSGIPAREIFWHYVIENFVIAAQLTQITEKKFNDDLTDYIIKHPEVNANELRRQIFTVRLRQDAQDSVVEKTLKRVLRKVASVQPEKEKIEAIAPEDVKEWISKWYSKISKEQFYAFLRRENTTNAPFIIQFIENTVRLFRARGLPGARSPRFVNVIYGIIVNYLYVEKKRTFTKSEFLSFASLKLAEHLETQSTLTVEILQEEYDEIKETEVIKKRKYTNQEILRFFFLFGALPAYGGVKTTSELNDIIAAAKETDIRAVFSNLDPFVLPLIAKRIRYQFDDEVVQKIFDASPELTLAEIVEESFKEPLEVTLSKLSDQKGRLYQQLKQLQERGIQTLPPEVQKSFAEAFAEQEVLSFLQKGRLTTAVTPVSGVDVSTRGGLIAGIYKMLHEKPKALTDSLKEAVSDEAVRTQWIKHLPEDLLLRIAHLLIPDEIGERVKWVDLFITRRIKEKKYHTTYSELKQLEWKHILTTPIEEIKRLISLQQVELSEPGKQLEGEAAGKDQKGELKREKHKSKGSEQEEAEAEEKKRGDEERLKKQREKEKREQLERKYGREPIYVINAGLVILHPYLSRLFSMLELLEDKKFKDNMAAQKAVYILQYIAYKDDKSQEFELALNKVLCGLDIFEPLDIACELTDKEKELCESLVNGVIQNWPSLGKTSADNFRVSFLHREGRLEQTPNGGWQLHVEQKAWDLLMDTLPWPINMVILPWMKKTLTVEWR